jgi:hypothetical protein
MTKVFFNFLIILVLAGMGHILADEGTLEIRTSGFIPTSQRFKDVYGDVGLTVGVEASRRFCGCYNGWVDFDFFPKSKSHGQCCKSRIDIYNGSLGINYFIPVCCGLESYIGLGPSFSRVNIKNHSYCGKERVSKFAVGGIIKTGLCFDLCDPVYINVFADYLYLPVHFHHTVDCGGIKAGIGIGLRL